MKWRKLGRIFCPSGQHPWMATHATAPIALRLKGNLYRVYFSSRDEKNRSHVCYVELNIKSPMDTLNISDEPVLGPGPLGHFDDHGVYASCIIKHRQKMFMYYIGWNPGVRRPLFYSSIGLAVSEDMGRTFSKVSHAPILGRSDFDPCLVLLPCVMKDRGRWRMWYGSGFKWEEIGENLDSYYHIKYAESKDGLKWQRRGLVSIDLRPGEKNVAHPFVLKENDKFKMWYSHNFGHGYRIGYAESADGYVWTRMDDEVGIGPSLSGWDSEALSHPHVFVHERRKYMMYNGNQFGREGFGLAVEV